MVRAGTCAAGVAMEVGNATTWDGRLVVLANWQGRAAFPRAKAAIAVKPRSKSVQPATIHAKVHQQLHLALILDPHMVLEGLNLMSFSVRSAAFSRRRAHQAA